MGIIMNRSPYTHIALVFPALIFVALTFSTGCGDSSAAKPASTQSIAMTSGSAQSAAVNVAFALPLVVTVTSGTTPVSGALVTFSAPSSGASGSFAGGANTATTNANGVATSTLFTADGTTGGYMVTATVSGTATAADFLLTNTNALVISSNYSFFLTGTENSNGGPNFYTLAGSVTVDSNGVILSGEQDYNDAFGLISPQPSGDIIVGGSLRADPASGQGALTLVTNNLSLGFNGTETLGVQFVNASHALIAQFDNSATSSGSIDAQTLPSTLGGGYAFTLSGVDAGYNPLTFGGVFSLTGTSLQNGLYDVNDSGTVSLGVPFTATVSAPDSFGRGTITGDLLPSINYYIVGPEVMRIIDVDPFDSAVGSAYGQGGGTFSNASLGSSVFGVQGNSFSFLYASAGQITVPASGTFLGIGDIDEEGTSVSAQAISGTYSIASNGYGSLTVPDFLVDLGTLGIYMTDPALNLMDPNNTTSGLGGALVMNSDAFLVGTGILLPQTDTSTASFTGNYAFGAQGFYSPNSGCFNKAASPGGFCGNGPWEFDLIGQGSVSAGALTGVGLVNDPGNFFPAKSVLDVGAAFSGTIVPDALNAGRYLIPLLVVPVNGNGAVFPLTIYQANGGQLLWVDINENDIEDLFLGSLQQQGSLTGMPALKKTAARSKPKLKQ